MTAYFKMINAKGGVDGYKYKWQEVDNQYSVTGGAASVRTLISSNPFAIVVIGSPPFGGSLKVLAQEASGIPTFALADGAIVKTSGLPNAFGLYTDYTQEGYFAVNNLVKRGKTKIGLVYDDALDPGASAGIPSYASSHGARIVSKVSVTTDTTNYVPIALQMKRAGVDAVYLDTIIEETAGFLKAASQVGLQVTEATFSGNLAPQLFSLAGPAANGLYVNSLYPPLVTSNPLISDFKTEIAKYGGSSAYTGQGEIGWAAGIVFNQAIKNALSHSKTLSATSFEDALYAMNNHTVGLAKINYSRPAHYAIGGVNTLSLYRVENGKFVQVG